MAQTRSTLDANEVARWLAQHARDVRTHNRERSSLYGQAALALVDEHERQLALVGDVFSQ